MTIDLRKCESGQQMRLRNGDIVSYVGQYDSARYPHLIRYGDGKLGCRTTDGMWNTIVGCRDVVEIITSPLDIPDRPPATAE